MRVRSLWGFPGRAGRYLALTKMRERWKAVVGHEGFYEVSDLGRVRSVDRVVEIPTRWGGTFTRTFKGVVRVLTKDEDGYLRVGIHRQGRKMVFAPVHRLVAEAFIPNPLGLPEVDHADNDRANAKASNLSWVTGLRNTQLMVERGRSVKGEAVNTAKLTGPTVARIRARAAAGEKYVHLAREFGVSDVAIRLAVLGRTWGHL